jgi:hypothetical protein
MLWDIEIECPEQRAFGWVFDSVGTEELKTRDDDFQLDHCTTANPDWSECSKSR